MSQCCATFIACLIAIPQFATAADVIAIYDADSAAYRIQLAELAASCRERGLSEEASYAAGWNSPTPPEKERYYLLLPDGVKRHPGRSLQPEFVEQFKQLRTDRAARLF